MIGGAIGAVILVITVAVSAFFLLKKRRLRRAREAVLADCEPESWISSRPAPKDIIERRTPSLDTREDDMSMISSLAEEPEMVQVESVTSRPMDGALHSVKRVPVPALLESENPFGDDARVDEPVVAVANPFEDPKDDTKLSALDGEPSRLSADSSL